MNPSRRIRQHVRSNVVGYVAVFLALSGTATALPGTNKVDSGDIKNGQVTTLDIRNGDVKSVDLGTNSVSASKISNLAIGTDQLGPQAVTAEKLAGGAVTGAALADDSVSSAAIAEGAVDSAAVADGSLTGDDIDPTAYDFTTLQRRVDESCPAGQAVKGIGEDGSVDCALVGDGSGGSELPAWINVTVQPNWEPYASGFAPPQCYLDAFGIVHLRGVVRRTGSNNDFSSPVDLPAPCTTRRDEISGGVQQAFVLARLNNIGTVTGFSSVYLTPEGRLDIQGNVPAEQEGISLDGVSFRPSD